MNKIAPILSTLAAITVCVVQGEETPKGWFHAGNRPNDYKMSVDRQIVHRGKASASLQSTVQETSGFVCPVTFEPKQSVIGPACGCGWTAQKANRSRSTICRSGPSKEMRTGPGMKSFWTFPITLPKSPSACS